MVVTPSLHVIARSVSDEAIHFSASCDMDCFASLAMTVSGIGHKSTFSRREAPEVLHEPWPSNQREQGMPGARCTRGLVLIWFIYL